ncbi:hypothetical protein [Citrobacter werkmanii]|uniref:hypothetical protein n=1 Tax=Citrobacter werkmanii TaxID=67827 RepID=UPI00388DBD64
MKNESLDVLLGTFSNIENDNKKYDENASKLETEAFNSAKDDGQTRTKLTISFLRGFWVANFFLWFCVVI